MFNIALSPHIPSVTSKKNGLESLKDLVSDTINMDLDIPMVCKYDASVEIDYYLSSPKVDKSDNPLA